MSLRKHSLRVDGVLTSLSVDEEFWDGLREIASERGVNATTLVNEINSTRQSPNLSAAIRIFVVTYFMERSRGF